MIRIKKYISLQNFLLALGLAVSGLAVLLMLTGCSAQKKLNKSAVKVANNKEATGVFFDEYAKNNDISQGEVIYLPGTETIKEKVVFDTQYLPGKATVIREKYYTDRLRVDSFFSDNPKTLSTLKLAKTQNEELDAALATLRIDFSEMEKKLKAEIKRWRSEVYIHREIWIAIILFFAIRLASKFLKPLLSLYFPGLKFLK